jgi:predicted glycosyltransferase
LSRKLVWIDASTPKRGVLAATLARLLRSEGFEVLITARSYDYTVKVLELLGERYVITGVHGGGSLRGKLLADIGRMVDLEVVVEEYEPGVLISYPSPPAVRVAFGHGIPYIALGDTPHGIAMNRLSYPLATVAVFSEFIADEMEKFVLKGFTAVETFRGVDELLWVKDFKPNAANVEALGLKPYSYIVFRPEEFKAHYYRSSGSSVILKLASKVAELGYTAVIIPRYREHYEEALKVKGALILDKPFSGLDLEYYSLAVVTGGISMAREAALLGTPGITIFDKIIGVDSALARIGFPIHYSEDYEKTLKMIKDVIEDPDKYRVNTTSMLEKLESPWPIILKWVKRLLNQ